jgi:hypothetical protein
MIVLRLSTICAVLGSVALAGCSSGDLCQETIAPLSNGLGKRGATAVECSEGSGPASFGQKAGKSDASEYNDGYDDQYDDGYDDGYDDDGAGEYDDGYDDDDDGAGEYDDGYDASPHEPMANYDVSLTSVEINVVGSAACTDLVGGADDCDVYVSANNNGASKESSQQDNLLSGETRLWGDEFLLSITAANLPSLEFEVYDRDMWKHDHIGTCKPNLTEPIIIQNQGDILLHCYKAGQETATLKLQLLRQS